jgi:hypothetical protein
MPSDLKKWFSRHRMIVSMWDLEHLPESYISGDMFEYPSGVYQIRHLDFSSAYYHAYRLTIAGAIVYAYDATCRLAKRLQRRLIRKLADWGLGNYPPEGCYPIWDDVWDRWR